MIPKKLLTPQKTRWCVCIDEHSYQLIGLLIGIRKVTASLRLFLDLIKIPHSEYPNEGNITYEFFLPTIVNTTKAITSTTAFAPSAIAITEMFSAIKSDCGTAQIAVKSPCF